MAVKITVSKVKFNPKELNNFAKSVSQSLNKRIQNQTEGFDKLTKNTRTRKKKAGYSRPDDPLIATGELSKSSSFSNSKGTLKIGYTDKDRKGTRKKTNAQLAEWHNMKNRTGKTFPQRSWIYLKQEQLQLLDTYIKKALGGE